MSFDKAGCFSEGKRHMIMKLENYKWAKANAFIHVCNLNLGNKGEGCGDAYKWVKMD